MLIVVSPAKTLDYETPPQTDKYSLPVNLEDSALLIAELRKLSPPQVSQLMGISDKLGALNFGRYVDWHSDFNPDNAKQALLAFKGDVYTGLDAESLTEAELAWAQQHLRILSGLYGILKPLDLMQPYRLEMGTKLANERGKDLYQFWGDTITEQLNSMLKAEDDPILINLASNEYFKSVNKKLLAATIITPVFKDLKNGKYKIISFYAKKARGLMSRYIIQNKITAPEKIKQFDIAGYQFNPAMTEGNEWVFTRDAAE